MKKKKSEKEISEWRGKERERLTAGRE